MALQVATPFVKTSSHKMRRNTRRALAFSRLGLRRGQKRNQRRRPRVGIPKTWAEVWES
jgi:hypothetical protein